MTRSTNARIAGSAFLLYIAVGVTMMFLGAGKGEGTAARLADIAQHTGSVHLELLLSPIIWFCAIVLGVTLYGLTREEDPDLAILVLSCRLGEGLVGATSTIASLGLLWLATAAPTAAPDSNSSNILGGFLFKVGGWNATISAILFAVGSTVFSYLLLRGRLVPTLFAWVGIVASVLLVVALPLQLAGYLHGSIVNLMWIPMALFEVPLGILLIIKGVAPRQAKG